MVELLLAAAAAYFGYKGARKVGSAYSNAKAEMYAEQYGDPYNYYDQPYYEDPYSGGNYSNGNQGGYYGGPPSYGRSPSYGGPPSYGRGSHHRSGRSHHHSGRSQNYRY